MEIWEGSNDIGFVALGARRDFKFSTLSSTSSKILDFHAEKDSMERLYLVAKLEMDGVSEDSIYCLHLR